MKINKENWKYDRLTLDNLLAFISFGASFKEELLGSDKVIFEYSLVLTDLEYKEIYSTTYQSLDQALENLQTKYGQWELLEANKSDSGCSTCAAH